MRLCRGGADEPQRQGGSEKDPDLHVAHRDLIDRADEGRTAEVLDLRETLLHGADLVEGDRLYCTVDFFAAVHRQGCWGLFRRNRLVGLHKLQRLRKRRHANGCLEEWLVRAGTGGSTPAHTLRDIRWRRGGTRYDLLTNVLEPTRLAAEEALALYPARWPLNACTSISRTS